MHRSWSTVTTPPSPFVMARAGHTVAQAGSSQCMHEVETYTFWPFAVVYGVTARRAGTSSGVPFALRQASTHCWQFTQFDMRTRNPYCMPPCEIAASASCGAAPALPSSAKAALRVAPTAPPASAVAPNTAAPCSRVRRGMPVSSRMFSPILCPERYTVQQPLIELPLPTSERSPYDRPCPRKGRPAGNLRGIR